jgi:hypothetical protein
VFKGKGNPNSMDNYRGIAVGIAISKLFSIIITNRLDEWAEINNKRAKGQAGFRKDKSTTDNIFVLQHIIEHSRLDCKPLFTAFIDSKSI